MELWTKETVVQNATLALEARVESINVSDIDMLRSKVFELHRGELKDELRLPGPFLKADFLNFVQDEGFDFDRVEAKSPGELVASLKRDDAAFEDISPREPFVDL